MTREIKINPSPCATCPQSRRCNTTKMCVAWKCWFRACWRTLQRNMRRQEARRELIANLLDMAESYKAMCAPYDTREELHYQDYETCIQAAAMLREDGEKC